MKVYKGGNVHIIKTGKLHRVVMSFSLNGHEASILEQRDPEGKFNGYYEVRVKHPNQGAYTAGLYPLYQAASNCYNNAVHNIQEKVHESVG